jgi:hypothetical protein
MSQEIRSQSTCSICGETIKGEACVKYKASEDLVTGYQCQNCETNLCAPPKRHLKFGILRGWKKTICPQCGELFGPGKIFIIKSGTKNINRAVSLLQRENLLQETAKIDELRTILHSHGSLVVDRILDRINRTPTWDVNSMVSFIISLVKITEIGDFGLFEDGKVEDRMYVLAKSKKHVIRMYALQMLVRIEEVRRIEEAMPMLVDALLSDKSVDVRAMLAAELGRITDDEEVVDALIRALNDHARPQRTAVTLAELFHKEPSVSELAAKSLEKIGNPRGLKALAMR